MTPIIVTFQSPKEIDDYIDAYNNNVNYHIDNLLDLDDIHEWPVDKNCSVGDFVFFRTGVDSAKKMNVLIREAEHVYPDNPGFIDFLRQDQKTYRKYAGTLFEVGVIEKPPYTTDDGKVFASIGSLHILQNPIPYKDVKKIKKVVSGGAISKLNEEQLRKTAALIIDNNPELDFDELRSVAITDLLQEIEEAHNDEQQTVFVSQIHQVTPDVQSDHNMQGVPVTHNHQPTNSSQDFNTEVMDVHNDRHEVVIRRTSAQFSRDQQLVRKLKALYNCRCQLCDPAQYWDIPMDNGQNYIEVHHIIPNCIGYDDEGKSVDTPGNMIIVCPNHHRYLHFHKGGEYRLDIENGELVLKNTTDTVRVKRDLHLRKLMN